MNKQLNEFSGNLPWFVLHAKWLAVVEFQFSKRKEASSCLTIGRVASRGKIAINVVSASTIVRRASTGSI
jgi:hypothetical protein